MGTLFAIICHADTANALATAESSRLRRCCQCLEAPPRLTASNGYCRISNSTQTYRKHRHPLLHAAFPHRSPRARAPPCRPSDLSLACNRPSLRRSSALLPRPRSRRQLLFPRSRASLPSHQSPAQASPPSASVQSLRTSLPPPLPSPLFPLPGGSRSLRFPRLPVFRPCRASQRIPAPRTLTSLLDTQGK